MGDRAGNILLLTSSLIMLIMTIIYVIGLGIAFRIAALPETKALILVFLSRLVFYLVVTIVWFILAIVGKKKGEHLGLGIASTVVTGFLLLWTIWFLFRVIFPILPLIPPTMSLVIVMSMIIIVALISLGTIGGVLKIIAAHSSGA